MMLHFGFSVQGAFRKPDDLFYGFSLSQAEDRCHRIGQTKPVTVYRLVTSGTVDERVYEIATAKLERSEVLLDKDEGAEAGGR